jgi:tetratricopeptide (TPR) repeat protein
MKLQIKSVTILGGIFFIFFLLLTPLGLFNNSIPEEWQTGYYSVTQIDPGDDTGYYIYLRSAFFDGDLDFINENKYAHTENFNSTGYVFNNWQIGQSVLFFPFFLIGHLIAILLNSLGYSFSIDGYSTPYYMATAIAAQTYTFIGLLLLYKILTKYFSQASALITTIGIWLGTPLIYYSFIRQRMAHGTEFLFSIIFITVWLKFRDSRNKYDHALVGLFFGLLCSIRMINILYLSIYIIDQVVIWFKNNQKDNNLKQHLIRIVFFFIFSALALTPQFLVWNQLDGALLDYINKAISVLGGQSSSSNSLTLLGEKVFQFFFGSKWSLALTTPIFFLGIIGLFLMPNSAKDLLPGFIVFLLLNFLLALTALDSQSYGNRYLLPSIGILAFGVAGAIGRFKGFRTFFNGGIVLIILFIILQYLIMIQYKILVHYNDPGFTFKALSGIPNLIFENSSLLSRSTNFFKIIFSEKSELFNKESFLFLVLFPGAQFICIIITSFLFLRLNKNNTQKNYSAKKIVTFISFSILFFLFYLFKIAPTKTEEEIKLRTLYLESVYEGDTKARNGNIKKAFALFNNAAKSLPNYWGSYLRMAHAYDAQSDYKTANRYYKKVLELNPYNAEPFIKLGRNNFRLGHLKEAEFYLKKSIQLSPNNKTSLHYLGILFVEKNLTPEAIKMFELSLAVDPNYKSAHLNFAILLGMLKQYQKATVHFKEATRLGADKIKIKALSENFGLRLED